MYYWLVCLKWYVCRSLRVLVLSQLSLPYVIVLEIFSRSTMVAFSTSEVVGQYTLTRFPPPSFFSPCDPQKISILEMSQRNKHIHDGDSEVYFARLSCDRRLTLCKRKNGYLLFLEIKLTLHSLVSVLFTKG